MKEEDMSPGVFLDRGSPPGDRELGFALGKTSALWAELKTDLASEFAPLTEKWSFSGKSLGWLLQLRWKDKTVVNLVPCQGYFVASLALGEKACEAAEGGGLPEPLLDVIRKAPKYPEGRGVRIEVHAKKDLPSVTRLASLRMEGK
jgi:hypothetical protein